MVVKPLEQSSNVWESTFGNLKSNFVCCFICGKSQKSISDLLGFHNLVLGGIIHIFHCLGSYTGSIYLFTSPTSRGNEGRKRVTNKKHGQQGAMLPHMLASATGNQQKMQQMQKSAEKQQQEQEQTGTRTPCHFMSYGPSIALPKMISIFIIIIYTYN